MPQSYDAESGSSENHGIKWKDRVALYAQFSAEETLQVLLDALQGNTRAGPSQDDSIEALYAFANFDVWEITHVFFGRRMDLGQFERFKRVMVAAPYDILLAHERRVILSSLHRSKDSYISRISFEAPRRDRATFVFRLSRVALGPHTSWMVDSILQESEPSSAVQ